MSEKPEALRLADELEVIFVWNGGGVKNRKAAAELRRLHAENEVLTAKIKAREDEILTHSEAVYEATKLLSEEREKNERLREALNRFEYSSDGHIKRYPEEEEVIAALRREGT